MILLIINYLYVLFTLIHTQTETLTICIAYYILLKTHS